jgi:4-hydroxy-tetrahydrodipicolinate synthase
MFNIKGSIVALITPMFENGEVDFVALKNLVEFHINNGTAAIVSVGTTGESATLNNNEHLEVIRQTIAFANGRIPIIAGTGANSTSEAISLTSEAKSLGADAVLLVTPYYNKPTQEGLYQHYKAIAESIDIPQILYNVPGRTAVDMLPATIYRLSEVDNIVGIKDATGNLDTARELIEILPSDFLKYSGDDGSALDFIHLGGDGGISVSSNICPREVADIYNLAQNNYEQAKIINDKLIDLHNNLFIEPSPIPVKFALYKMGKCAQGIRLPLTFLSEDNQEILIKTLKSLGVI